MKKILGAVFEKNHKPTNYYYYYYYYYGSDSMGPERYAQVQNRKNYPCSERLYKPTLLSSYEMDKQNDLNSEGFDLKWSTANTMCHEVFDENLSSNIDPGIPIGNEVKSLEGGGTTVHKKQPKNTPILQITAEDDPKTFLQNLKAKNKDRPIIAHLNINFLDIKFEPLKDMIKENVDISLISETKLNDTFPDGQFTIDGYKEPIRLDRNRHGGGLMFFVKNDLDCKEIYRFPKKKKES